MAVKVKPSDLTTHLIPGYPIPPDLSHSEVGTWLENEIKKDWRIQFNNGKGVDLPQFGVEVKSRDITSTSDHTVTKMIRDDILKSAWDKNNVAWQKLQYQYRMHYDFEKRIIEELVFCNFTHWTIQSRLEAEFNAIKLPLLRDKKLERTTKEDRWLFIERDIENPGIYQVRLKNRAMDEMLALIEMMDPAKSTYSIMFEDDKNAPYQVEDKDIKPILQSSMDVLDFFTNVPSKKELEKVKIPAQKIYTKSAATELFVF